MTDDADKRRRERQAVHCYALNQVLEGVEVLADPASVAATYLSRAGRIMCEMRFAGMTDAKEVENAAAIFVDLAMSDEEIAVARDPAGNEMDGSETTH